MINSQLPCPLIAMYGSISKGMGDQFSALLVVGQGERQYIKGDG